MKLPFNNVIAPLMKPYFNTAKKLCVHPTFYYSVPYTYFYSSLGLIINMNHLRKHVGEKPISSLVTVETIDDLENDYMLVHDLRIIATSIGLIQYACLLAGCYTENPALFLPHLVGQMIVIAVKMMNAMILLTSMKRTLWSKLKHSVPALMLLTFNWLQEFCVFRRVLCICDL